MTDLAPLATAGGQFVARMVLWASGLRWSGADILSLAAGQLWARGGLLAWASVAAGLPLLMTCRIIAFLAGLTT